MNTFINELEKKFNTKYTENSATALRSTLSKVYDMFAFGGAYRNRSDEDVIRLFSEAYDENPDLALKCLFYLRDIRGAGQGERRFFDVCYRWLTQTYPTVAIKLLQYIPEYGRWDEVLKVTTDTDCWKNAVDLIKHQLKEDICSNGHPSLCAKWMPSENASSQDTIALANYLRKSLNLTSRQYRKMLSELRTQIKLVESQMSQDNWNEIEFDKLPSKAGFKYRAAFGRNPETAARYKKFIKNKNTKVNAGTMYPYEIVNKIPRSRWSTALSETEKNVLDKYWSNLKDYFHGKSGGMICVCDLSGSMTCSYGMSTSNVTPMDISVSLGIYTAERLNGPFKNRFITFSENPHLIRIEGDDIYSKVQDVYRHSEIANTDLPAVFKLLKRIALQPNVNPADIPETLVIISDMEIDRGSNFRTKSQAETTMDRIAVDWAEAGLKFPKIVYWNCNARNNTILQEPSSRITYVSGCSPSIFEQVMTGKDGVELMLQVLQSSRYEPIQS